MAIAEWIVWAVLLVVTTVWTYGSKTHMYSGELNIGTVAITAWWWILLIGFALLPVNKLHLLWVAPAFAVLVPAFTHKYSFLGRIPLISSLVVLPARVLLFLLGFKPGT